MKWTMAMISLGTGTEPAGGALGEVAVLYLSKDGERKLRYYILPSTDERFTSM